MARFYGPGASELRRPAASTGANPNAGPSLQPFRSCRFASRSRTVRRFCSYGKEHSSSRRARARSSRPSCLTAPLLLRRTGAPLAAPRSARGLGRPRAGGPP